MLNTSEKTDLGMLPQSQALESTSADKLGVSTKRGVDAMNVAAGVQLGRGESTNDSHVGSLEPSPEDLRDSTAIDDLFRDNGSNPLPNRVAVLDKNKQPLDPCHPARARELLKKGRAVVHRLVPFVIRLKDRKVEESVIHEHVLRLDPGSRTTGLAVTREVEAVDKQSGELNIEREGLFLAELEHRSGAVSKKIKQRAGHRRHRRSKNLRYRAPRFDNRTSKHRAKFAPSLRSRMDHIDSWVQRMSKSFPNLRVELETTRFDTQLMDNPGIKGVEYQRGTLRGTNVREYILERDNRTCVYCGAQNVPLNLDHVVPRAFGGSDRVSNLVLSCVPCNQSKGKQSLEEFVKEPAKLKRIKSQVKKSLRDAAVMNATRYEVSRRLQVLGFDVREFSGAQTKYNRQKLGIEKTHALDALCVGEVDVVKKYPDQVLRIRATGRGSYSRTALNKYGFPRLTLPCQKLHYGFQTGDLVKAVVLSGKNKGTHIGRVAVRKDGGMRVGSRDRINHKKISLLQRADGYEYKQEQLLGVRGE